MSNRRSPNRESLEAVAERLGELRSRVVFVGGQVVELMLTDPAAVRIRPTNDVDVIVTVSTKGEFRALEEQIGRLGFRNDLSEGAPVCRWVTPEGFLLDFMPVDERVLGFSNRWYQEAAARAEPRALTQDLTILTPPAPVFVASKLEAFQNRGDWVFA